MRTGIFAAVTIALVTQAPAAFASQLSWEAIRQGDTGREVYTLQYLLREAGLTVSIDGIFGTDTDARVRDFQRAKGLTVDGVVGGNTWEALIKTVRQGDNNNAVRAVQDQLRSGYGYASVTVDGIFGSGTDTAVRDFQTKRELGADGIVGLNTWHALVNGSGTVGTGTGGTTATLASQILSNGRITLGTSSDTTGGNPKQNMVDTSNGLPVKRGCATNANCGLTTTLKRSMLEGMLKVANTGTIYITSIAGGKHSANSDHYAGLAFDIGIWNGTSLSSPNSAHTAARNACIAAGSDPSQTFDAYHDPTGGHKNHVHCAWN
ncbi:peptidoglycan-binding domain-containing protein [Deinococcus hopiensis]|uniref:Peptidoglycan-binding (PGRP) domain of peptidoglycan hydrolases-containing protein n=1 Tax=Deinococcus hopiensis KR-140 TaxID=695939 RepID=A0A1W1UA36_9DEIO|nr:peptidoglycan-binding protein [Deinococcus hopiensis]SMB77939.1 Peptidoglycan-binding (PGRP) domain of peptidoglycan hydrolases-containing protein [Deinococcus hopiensis KR-140]